MPAYVRNSTSREPYGYEYTRKPGSSPVQTGRSYGTTLLTTSLSGFYDPSWKSSLEQGRSATTSLTATSRQLTRTQPSQWKITWDFGPGVKYKDTVVTSAFWNSLSSLPGVPATATAVPGVYNAFFNKLYDALNKFEGATAVGELVSTLNTLKNPIKSLMQMAESLRDVQTKKAVHSLLTKLGKSHNLSHVTRAKRALRRHAAGTWLSYQFGVVPLIKESRQLIDKIVDVSRKSESYTVRHSGTGPAVHSQNAQLKTNCDPLNNMVNSNRVRTIVTETSTHCSGAVRLRQSNLQSFGFDPGSWVLAAWELIPWSFLVDYVLPIDNFIKAACIRQRDLVYTSATTRAISRVRFVEQLYIRDPSICKAEALINGLYEGEAKRVVRTALNPGFTVPALKITTSTTALLNSFALLIKESNK